MGIEYLCGSDEVAKKAIQLMLKGKSPKDACWYAAMDQGNATTRDERDVALDVITFLILHPTVGQFLLGKVLKHTRKERQSEPTST